MATKQDVRNGPMPPRTPGSSLSFGPTPHAPRPRTAPARRSHDTDAPTIRLRTTIAPDAAATREPRPARGTERPAPRRRPTTSRAAATSVTTVTVLVPAHNEEIGIAATI
ncbi:MAG TPA: hypothetical protein VNP37_03135, partial [Actinomycetospora sp.]|nr:hypothetical protein [Actinomycetospora sp.]